MSAHDEARSYAWPALCYSTAQALQQPPATSPDDWHSAARSILLACLFLAHDSRYDHTIFRRGYGEVSLRN